MTTAASPISQRPTDARLLPANWHARSPATIEQVLPGFLFACAIVSVLTTAGIVCVLLFESIGFFHEVSFAQFFGDTQWTPLFADKHFGIWPLLCGTLLTTGIAMAVAIPFGLLSAIYLGEFLRSNVRRVLKPVLEVLAGVPTVVYGYFALNTVTPLLQHFIPNLSGFNALGAGIVMGIMILPIIASLSDDAIRAVPDELREASYALGASKLSTIFRVVLPTAFSGIAASVILAISRAIGETMIVAIAAGEQAKFGLDPRSPTETMTAYIAQVSLGDTPSGTIEYQTIFAVGITLFAMTFALNLVSHRLRRAVLRGGQT